VNGLSVELPTHPRLNGLLRVRSADAARAALWASPKMLVARRRTAPATWAALVQLFGEENARYHLERCAAIVTATPAMLHTHWAVLVAVFGEEVRLTALTFNLLVLWL
jgi:hypothetical protein